MLTLNIIGAGKVGCTLGKLWALHRVFDVQDVLTANTRSAVAAVDFIGAGRPTSSITGLRAARVWMLTPPDDRIAQVCDQLGSSRLLHDGDIVFHCSGSQPSSILVSAARSGAVVASLHPLKSIAQPDDAVAGFGGTWCGVEGDAAALAKLKPAFEKVGARLFDIDPSAKLLYHAASVIVCNYLPALIEAGTRCFEAAGIQRAAALQVMEPLVRETLENVFKVGAARALTGPIARGDHALVARQLEALERWNPQIAEIYRRLGAIAVELAREHGKAEADALAAIDRTLAHGK